MEKKSDLRVRKTYDALMKAFIELLSKKTFDDITVNELCEAAMIRRPTFYSHFEDKYDFLRFYLNEIQMQIENESDELTSSREEHFEHCWHMLMKFIDDHPEFVREGLKTASLPVIFDIISEHLSASIRNYSAEHLKATRPELLGSVDTYAAFIVGGMMQNIKRYLYGECKDSETLTHEMVTIFKSFWRGILTSG